jgi:hypothetical protein
MDPLAPSIRALLGSLGLVTGLVGVAGCGTQNPTGCGNAANCNPIDSGVGDTGYTDTGNGMYLDTGTMPDVAEDTNLPCGNGICFDSGTDAGDDAADSSSQPVDSGPDTMPTCGTGNGPVCPSDASE